MYLSKNSRYVLQKAQVLSPTFFKVAEKNLSVKTPKDDPTKPSLRLNIPKETSHEDKSVSGQHSARPSSVTPGFDSDLLSPENEIQFPSFVSDEILVNEEQKGGSKQSNLEPHSSHSTNYWGSGNKTDDSRTSYVQSDSGAGSERKAEARKVESAGEKRQDEVDPKSLYIIINVPERADEKSLHAETVKEKRKGGDVERPQTYFQRAKADGQENEVKKSARNVIKAPFYKGKPLRMKRIEISEIEEPATYVFHVRLDKNAPGKPFRVGWVPEKEVTTRNEKVSFASTQVKTTDAVAKENTPFMGKQVSSIEEFPDLVRHPEPMKKPQPKTETKTNAQVAAKPPAAAPRVDEEPSEKYMRGSVGSVKEDAIVLPKFERDDFGTVRAAKTYPFKLPEKGDVEERKEEISREASTASAAAKPREAEVQLAEVQSAKVQSAKVQSAKVQSAEVQSAEVQSAKVQSAEVQSAEVQSAKVQSAKVQSAEVQSAEVQSAKVQSAEVQSAEVKADEVQSAEVKADEVQSTEVQAGKVQVAEVQAAESPEQQAAKVEGQSATETDGAVKIEYSYPPPTGLSFDSPEIPPQSGFPQQYAHAAQRHAEAYAAPESDSPYLSIHELRKKLAEATPPPAPAVNEAPESPYYSVHDYVNKEAAEASATDQAIDETARTHTSYYDIKDLKKEKVVEKSTNEAKNPPPGKHLARSTQDKLAEKSNSVDSVSFQTSSSCVSIGCEKISGGPMKFCAAFPPLLSEALKSRFALRKDSHLDENLGVAWQSGLKGGKSEQTRNARALSENSILFPKKECENFDCESLFATREEMIMNIMKKVEDEKTVDAGGDSGKGAEKNLKENESKSSVDSLSVMKKVKEIIQFDLDNVVKIFSTGKPTRVPSVVVLKGDRWQVDSEELKRQSEISETASESKTKFLGDDVEEGLRTTKYLPSRNEATTEMKLWSDSVVAYDPKTGVFAINKDALADAIARKTSEPLEDVTQTLDFLANGKALEGKGGDSILVFDDETQSWKVDFSILEKRETQQKIEEELAKRSELILETFEGLEKGHIPSVAYPETKDKKTFDYKSGQWNAYNPDKKTKERSTKFPFKESNAEEIRKKNSDLYENLFVANKKGTAVKKSEEDGRNLHKPEKKASSYLMSEQKEPTESSGKTPIGPGSPQPGAPPPKPTGLPGTPTIKDDNFWGSFLDMNILPRDIREIPKINPVKPPLPPPPAPKEPLPTPKKIEEPLPEAPSKKIEEPKFKIRLPFTKDKKVDKPTVPKSETPASKSSTPPTSAKSEKKEPPCPPEGKPAEKEKKAPPCEKSEKKEPPCPPDGKPAEKEKKGPPPCDDKPGEKGTPPGKDPKKKTLSPLIGSEKDSPPKTDIKAPSASTKTKIHVPKPGDKVASAADHYVSDKIIEISRNKPTDGLSKIKTNKIETVKLNITSDKRMPSRVTEINLNKKFDESAKETTAAQQSPVDGKVQNGGIVKKDKPEKKTFHKNFEKYKTPFSDPDYEEKSLKIKSDIESNPNMKKLDNWNKTLVLHDIMKPPENIESWLKDETDKMATLLLKVLQEAADGKPKKKHPPMRHKGDKQIGKANPYDNIRKKHETAPDFMIRVRTVNLSPDNDKKVKPKENAKPFIRSEQPKDVSVQPERTTRPVKMMDATRLPAIEKLLPTSSGIAQVPASPEASNTRVAQTSVELTVPSAVTPRETSQVTKIPLEITEEIPGPEILKRISNAWKVFPILGSQMTIFTLLRVFQLVNLGSSILGSPNPDKSRRHAFAKLFLKYGPIVNVQGPLSGNVILIHAPEHLTAVFEQDITASVRSVFDSLEQSRHESEENALTVGISTDWSKPEWSDLRRGTIDALTRGSSTFFGLCDAAADSLVANVRKNRNSQNCVSEDFMEEIRRWSLEGLCSVIFEKSFGFLEGRAGSGNWLMEPDKLYLAVDEATSCLNKCERGFQMWRLMSTPSSMALGRAYRSMASILSKHLYQAEMNLKGKGGHLRIGSSLPLTDLTFMESMLLNDGMTTDEITCNLVDIILIGTNAMNSAMGFLLYNLAQNVRVQMKLFKELKEVLPHKDSRLSYEKLESSKYLRACLKESLRLHFPIPVLYRLLQTDILLANYIVPKGTYVVMDYRVSGMKEQVFDEPEKFVPERWLPEEKWMQSTHPFGAFPLCHGPRSDLAKKVVEMQLLSCVAKLIRNFLVEYQYGEIQGTDTLMSAPDKQLKLNFIEREE